MTLTVSHGTITVGTPGGIVSDNGSASVTLTGTAAAINAALATTSYTGNLNYFGSDSLAVTTTRHQQRRQLRHPDRRHHGYSWDRTLGRHVERRLGNGVRCGLELCVTADIRKSYGDRR